MYLIIGASYKLEPSRLLEMDQSLLLMIANSKETLLVMFWISNLLLELFGYLIKQQSNCIGLFLKLIRLIQYRPLL